MERPPRTTPPESERGFERPNGADDWRRHAREAYGAPPPPPRRANGLDFAALFILLDALRRAVPSDLQEQFTRLVREALLALRALIDWYLDRLDHRPREPRVEDIPIE
jgi:hypothetical protein